MKNLFSLSISPLHLLLILVPTLAWGLNFPFARISTAEFPPFFLLSARFSLVALILLPFFPKPPQKIIPLLILAVLFGPLHAGTMLYSMYLEFPASTGVLIQQLSVPMTLIISVIFLKVLIHRHSIIGLIFSFCGLFLLIQAPSIQGNYLGLIVMLISALSGAIYLLFLKEYFQEIHPLAIIAWVSLLTIPVILPFTFFLENNHLELLKNASLKAYGAAFYGFFISSVLGHSIWYFLVKKYPLETIAPITLLTPVFGVLGGVLILDEPLNQSMIFGGLLTLIGSAIVLIRRPNLTNRE